MVGWEREEGEEVSSEGRKRDGGEEISEGGEREEGEEVSSEGRKRMGVRR